MSVPPKKHSKTEALKIIRRIRRDGVVVPTNHLKVRMRERGFEMRDVIEAINKGAIYDEAEMHPKTGRWNYTVRGKTVDGESLDLVIDLDEDNERVVILTGMTR
jgi:hypothetical protein